MKLTDKEAILLSVNALPTADIWHEISQEDMIAIYQQARRELARIEGELLEYQKLYNDVAQLLNSANFKLSEISRLANRERNSTGGVLPLNQRIPFERGGAFFVHWSCENCIPDDYDSSDSCHHCGKDRTQQ